MRIAIAKRDNLFGAMLLIAGCCIGAGMIGLPVVSALAGFMPSSIAMFLCYLFTTATGLLLLEATLWFDKRVNLLTIAEFALGKVGKYLTFGLFLFLFYCLFVAYMDAGGQLIAGILSGVFSIPFSREAGILLCTATIAGVCVAGTRFVDRINRLFVLGLAASYGALLLFGLPYIEHSNLLHMDLSAAISCIPILLICFGYQNLVPSLTYYLKKNVPALRLAIVIGNGLPFLIYFLWNYVILGMVPNHALQGQESAMVSNLLQSANPSASVSFAIKAFTICALMSSFIPNALTFLDFLRDGLKKQSSSLLYGLVFVPPMLCTLLYPQLFLKALSLAGGFVDVLLFGLLPTAIVAIGRYVKKVEGPYQVGGGKLLLGTIFITSCALLFIKHS